MLVGEIKRENFSKLDDITFDYLMEIIDMVMRQEIKVDFYNSRNSMSFDVSFIFKCADIKVDKSFILIKDVHTGASLSLDANQIKGYRDHGNWIDLDLKSYTISFCDAYYRES